MSSRDCPGDGCIRRLTMEVIKKPFSTLHQTSNARGHRSCSHFGSTCALTGACHGTRRPRAGRYVLRHGFHMLCLRCLAGAAGGRRRFREAGEMSRSLVGQRRWRPSAKPLAPVCVYRLRNVWARLTCRFVKKHHVGCCILSDLQKTRAAIPITDVCD